MSVFINKSKTYSLKQAKFSHLLNYWTSKKGDTTGTSTFHESVHRCTGDPHLD